MLAIRERRGLRPRGATAGDRLFYDHVDLAGHIDRTIWSYNQGVSIAANLARYRVSGNRAYLRATKRIAAAAYRYLIVGGRLDSQPIPFNAILFNQLLVLESVTGGDRYRAAMASYADWLWRTTRNPRTGLFSLDRSGPTDVIE